MWTFILFSWRNIWRQRRRSIIVITSMAIGIFGTLATKGFTNSFIMQMIDNTISTSIGHIAIHKKGFQENGKFELNFNPDETIMKSVNRVARTYAPKIKIMGMVRSSETARSVMIVGIDPEREKRVSKIHEYTSIKDGSKYLDDPDEGSILISKTMAKKLDLLIGDKLVMLFQDGHNGIVGESFTVKGVFESPFVSMDKSVVYVGIKKLQKITGLGNNISEITILLKDKNNADPVKKMLISGINNSTLEILSWKDMAPEMMAIINVLDGVMYIFLIVIFITVIFSVANILVMSIMERFHEIGVMKSIGTKPTRIFFMIMFEALNLGILGIFIGIAVSIIIIGITSVTGLDISIFSDYLRSFGTGCIIYPSLKVMDIIISFTTVMITTVIAALYPAVKAARIKPLEALNFI